jgi:hypothetical protein
MLIVFYQHLVASPVDHCQTLIYGAPRGAPCGSNNHVPETGGSADFIDDFFIVTVAKEARLSLNYFLFSPAICSHGHVMPPFVRNLLSR